MYINKGDVYKFTKLIKNILHKKIYKIIKLGGKVC